MNEEIVSVRIPKFCQQNYIRELCIAFREVIWVDPFVRIPPIISLAQLGSTQEVPHSQVSLLVGWECVMLYALLNDSTLAYSDETIPKSRDNRHSLYRCVLERLPENQRQYGNQMIEFFRLGRHFFCHAIPLETTLPFSNSIALLCFVSQKWNSSWYGRLNSFDAFNKMSKSTEWSDFAELLCQTADKAYDDLIDFCHVPSDKENLRKAMQGIILSKFKQPVIGRDATRNTSKDTSTPPQNSLREWRRPFEAKLKYPFAAKGNFSFNHIDFWNSACNALDIAADEILCEWGNNPPNGDFFFLSEMINDHCSAVVDKILLTSCRPTPIRQKRTLEIVL